MFHQDFIQKECRENASCRTRNPGFQDFCISLNKLRKNLAQSQHPATMKVETMKGIKNWAFLNAHVEIHKQFSDFCFGKSKKKEAAGALPFSSFRFLWPAWPVACEAMASASASADP